MGNSSCQIRADRKGVALVEFALVAPIFVLFIIGVLKIGRAMVVAGQVTNASREAARVASFDSTKQSATVTDAADAFLSKVGVTGATTTVAPNPPSSAKDGETVSVTVSIPYNQVRWLPASFFLGGKTLQATTVMCRLPAP